MTCSPSNAGRPEALNLVNTDASAWREHLHVRVRDYTVRRPRQVARARPGVRARQEVRARQAVREAPPRLRAVRYGAAGCVRT